MPSKTAQTAKTATAKTAKTTKTTKTATAQAAQAALFDPSQYNAIATEPIREIPLTEIDPDPNNPAQYSEKYSQLIGQDINVEDEEVEKLVEKIKANGYDTSAPIIVRPKNGRFMLARGHHTFVALWVLEKVFAPCIVREMTDFEAEVALLTLQGRKVPDWYALKVVCHLLESSDVKTVSSSTSIDPQSITNWRISYKFINRLVAEIPDVYPSFQKAVRVKDDSQNRDKRFSIYEAREIGQLPEDDQVWFAKSRLADPMFQAKQVKLIRLLKETRKIIEVTRWKSWMQWEQVRVEIYKEFSNSSRDESELAESIPELLKIAEAHYNDNRLPVSKDYYEVSKKPKKKTGYPKEEFLRDLVELSAQEESWNEVQISISFKRIVDYYSTIEQRYLKHLEQQAAEDIAKRQQIIAVNPQAAIDDSDPMLDLKVHPITGQIEFGDDSPRADLEKRRQILEEYTPRVFKDDLTSYSQSSKETYSVILTRISTEDAVIDEFFDHCDRIREMLTEDGICVIVCPSDLSYSIIEELEKHVSSLERLHVRPIDKKPLSKYAKPVVTITKTSSASPFIRPQECDHLLVFTRESNTPMREYGLQVSERSDIYQSQSIVNIFCNGQERFLDPFCTNGLIPHAAKSCGIKCDYLVSNELTFERIVKVAESATLPSRMFDGC
jgi:hypothetical protein